MPTYIIIAIISSIDSEKCAQVEGILNGAIKTVGSEGTSSPLEQVVFRLPCCVECHQALDDIDRLQEAINKLKTIQIDRMELLKRGFLSPKAGSQDSGQRQIWKQLVTCILKQAEPRVPTCGVNEGPFGSQPKKPRLEGGNVKEEPGSSDDDRSLNDECDEHPEEDFQPFHPEISNQPEVNHPPSVYTPRPPPRKGDVTNVYFSKLSDSLLLYTSTVIKVSPGEGLFCQEPGCSTHLATATDFNSLEAAKVHVNKVHLLEETYLEKDRECPLCGVELKGAVGFRMHLLSKEHGDPPYICHCCGKPFTRYYMLAPHLRSHQGRWEKSDDSDLPRKKFGCDQCPREFYKKSSLAVHKDSHLPISQRKQICCDQCPKKLMTSFALREHMERFHQTRKYISCHLCNKQFFWRESHKLAIHMRSHGTLPPHICDQCGKSFHAPQLLRIHQRNVHPDGDSRHQCEYCEMSYKIKRGLRRHQHQAHKDKVRPKDPEQSLRHMPPEHRPGFIGPKIAFPCQFCEKPFPLKCRLTQHLKKYHAEELKSQSIFCQQIH